jgi:AcrR family transcriptional regulator
MNTREKILDRALEMFNERGIEYVGLRELAAVLEMRVSNITYYFPIKDDLVFELSQKLSRKNSEVIIENKALTMTGFLEMLHRVFENHYEFRGLLRSFAHIMTQNKAVLASYKKIQTNRRATLASNIHVLVSGGYLKVENDEKLNFLVTALSMLSRYWISEMAVFGQHLSKEQQINQNLLMITNLFEPYTSAKAKKEMVEFREKLRAYNYS